MSDDNDYVPAENDSEIAAPPEGAPGPEASAQATTEPDGDDSDGGDARSADADGSHDGDDADRRTDDSNVASSSDDGAVGSDSAVASDSGSDDSAASDSDDSASADASNRDDSVAAADASDSDASPADDTGAPAMAAAPPEATGHGDTLAVRARARQAELQATLSALPDTDLRGKQDIEAALAAIADLMVGDPDHPAATTAVAINRWLETSRLLGVVAKPASV